MILNFNEHDQFALSCNEKRSCRPFGFTNVSVAVDGDEEAQLSAVPFSSASIKFDKNYIENNRSSHKISYTIAQKGLEVLEDIKTFDDIDIVEQKNTVINKWFRFFQKGNHIISVDSGKTPTEKCYFCIFT